MEKAHMADNFSANIATFNHQSIHPYEPARTMMFENTNDTATMIKNKSHTCFINCSKRMLIVWHCSDVIMGAMASQITSLTIVYSAVYFGAGQRKHQTSALLAICAGNSPVTVSNVSIWWRHHENVKPQGVSESLNCNKSQNYLRKHWGSPKLCHRTQNMNPRGRNSNHFDWKSRVTPCI